MTDEGGNRKRSWVGLGALAVLGIGGAVVLGWGELGGSGEPGESGELGGSERVLDRGEDQGVVDSAAAARALLEQADAAANRIRIAEHGRLRLDLDDLPADGPLRLALDLEDGARGAGSHVVRVVSEEGRRFDTSAQALPGEGSGVELEIDSRFLTAGRFMIEIETNDDHPLQLQRYVLEVE